MLSEPLHPNIAKECSMAGRKCISDGQRVHGKPCTVYAGYYPAPDHRVGYRGYVCSDHAELVAHLQELDALGRKPIGDDDSESCPDCGQSTFDSLLPTYLTVFVPGCEQQDWELWLCEDCSIKHRQPFQSYAVRTPDRDADAAASRSRVESAWAAFA